MNIKIGSKSIGIGQPAFIIAEAGVNHNGKPELAFDLIDAAAESGADCVKFQTFKAETVVQSYSPKANYQLQTTDPEESQYDMLKKLELDQKVYPELIEKASSLGIEFMSTPYDSSDVDFLDALGVPAFKAASISMVEPNFLRYIASKNKPIICSTGLCTLEEISQSLNFLPDYKKYLMLLQCTTDYPAQIEDSNILSMLELKKTTGCLVGYSDHTVNNVSVIAAIAHGATVIEKHLTLDKSAEGPDQENSYEPFEFKELVSVIRQTEQALGNGIKKPSERELKNIHGMRRGLVAKKDLHIGEKLEFSDFYLKRPANGISLIEFIQLKETTIKKALKKGDFLSSDHIN